MYKKGALTKRAQYQSVYTSGITKVDRYLVVKVLSNQQNISRFGFSVNKKVGKAVYRNKIRRLLQESSRAMKIKQGFDIVFVARREALNADFHQLKNSMSSLLNRMKLLESNVKETNSKIN